VRREPRGLLAELVAILRGSLAALAPQDEAPRGGTPISRLLDHFSDALARLIDALADPARRRRAALVFVLGYGALWLLYGLIAKSSQDLNADMAEMVVWTRELALGYPKHPPLLAWVLWAWFKIFPLADWAYLLLAVITVAAGIYLAIELSAEWLTGGKLAAVPFLLAAIPFYNFLGLKWDQNSILLPLWALAMWAMLRSLETRHLAWAALAGAAAAAALLSKYWSVFLLAALALAALFHGKRAAYFRSAAPWVTAGVFVAAVAPHVAWLIRENFPPITWVATRRTSSSFVNLLGSMVEYLGGTVAYAGIALLLVLIFVRPTLRMIADSWLPRDERRVPAILFWVPLLLPLAAAYATGTNLVSLWSTPALNLIGVMMLASPLVVLPRIALLRIATVVLALTLLSVAASPIIAFAILKRGVENNAAYARLAMQAAEREWRATTDKPLKLVGGPFVLVSSAAFYGTDRPSTYADFSRYLSPWVDDARIARDGMAILCNPDHPFCLDRMGEFIARSSAARRTEVTVARSWLAFTSEPKRFVIAIVPPRS
jgi:4-amino-4-deoxy-L-arabinose transferase-like glycosyltransferase